MTHTPRTAPAADTFDPAPAGRPTDGPPPRGADALPVRRGPWASLKFRVAAAGALAMMLSVGVATHWGASVARDNLVRQAELRERSETVRVAQVIGRELSTLLQALASAGTALDAATLSDPARLRQFVLSKPVLVAMFDGVFVADPGGRVLVFYDERGFVSAGFGMGDRAHFKQTVATGRTVASSLLTSRVTDEPVIVATVPVFSGSKVSAVIGGSLRVRQRSLLQWVSQLDQSASIVVTDANGAIMAHQDTARIGRRVEEDPVLQGAAEQWRRAGDRPAGGFHDLSDTGQLTNVATVEASSWLVWHWQSRESITQPALLALAQARQVGLAVVLASAVVLAALLSWMLHPLKLLRQRADRLLDRSLPPDQGWPGGSDEVLALAATLKRVAIARAEQDRTVEIAMGRLEGVLAASPAGIALTRRGTFELVSPALAAMLGRPIERLTGSTTEDMFARRDDRDRLGVAVAASFAQHRTYHGEWALRRADGTEFWAQVRAQAVNWHDADQGTIWVIDDVDAAVHRRRSLEWEATHDALTGLVNRAGLQSRLDALVLTEAVSRPAVLLVLDLDGFKVVNDTHGHDAGDAVLREVACCLRGAVRPDDLVARLGGDEFVIVLEHCTAEAARAVVETLRHSIHELAVTYGGHQLTVRTSIGMAELDGLMRESADWLRAADAGLYQDKMIRRAMSGPVEG